VGGTDGLPRIPAFIALSEAFFNFMHSLFSQQNNANAAKQAGETARARHAAKVEKCSKNPSN